MSQIAPVGRAVLMLLVLAMPAARGANEGAAKEKKGPLGIPVRRLINPDLRVPNNPPHLETPEQTYQTFLESASQGDYQRAAHTMDFSLAFEGVPYDDRRPRAEELARKLYYVLRQKLWVSPADLPANPQGDSGKGPVGSVVLGKVSLNGSVVPVELWRFEEKDTGKFVWVFSPSIVAKVEKLYEKHGPRLLERIFGHSPLWEWLILALCFVAAVALGWYAWRRMTLSEKEDSDAWHRGLLIALRTPSACLTTCLLLFLVNAFALTLTAPVARILDPLLLVLVIVSLGWAVLVAINFGTQEAAERYANEVQVVGSASARSMLTRIVVARRLVFLAIVGAIVGIVLLQLQLMEMIGYALLGAAGVAGVVVGIAAQPVLGNLMAGIQIAVTQPVRIGDTVIFEGEWGQVEEIAFSFLVIRTWDLRRLIVPLSYLISHPIENWTKSGANLIRAISLHVDYRTDIDAVRRKYEELLRAAESWDGKVAPIVQVVACNAETLEIRALCSAANASAAWNLQCEMREKLIRFLHEQDNGRYLPHRRLHVESVPNTSQPFHE